MTWAVFLRRCLMAQLCDVGFGGWLKILFDLEGDLAEAETVLPASVYEVLKHYVDGKGNVAELVKAANGVGQIHKVVFDGYAIMSRTFLAEGGIEFLLDLIGKGEFAELTQHGASVLVIPIPINAELTKSEDNNGAEGEVVIDNPDSVGLVVISYQYSTEENDAGGTTYNIISDYYAEVGNTAYIGGRNGSQ